MRRDGSWGTRVYIPEYLAKAPPRETSARGSSACSCLVHSGRGTLVYVNRLEGVCICVCVYVYIRLHVRSDARGTNTETHFSRCGYGACLKHVCARNPRTGRVIRYAHWRLKVASSGGLTTPSRGGTNPLAFAVPLGPTMPPLSSSALIIRRYTTNSATMALRETPESSCHGTRAATGHQRHC